MPFIGNRLTSDVGATTVASADLSSIVQELSSSELSKTARRFTKSTALPIRGSSRSEKYRKEAVIGDCPKGQNYYACQSTGFEGCCSKNACDPNVVCPEGNDLVDTTSNSTSTASNASISSDSNPSTAATESTAKSETREVKTAVTSAAGGPSQSSLSATAIRATEDVASAPSCPNANGTTYSDNKKIAYVVRCASDNIVESYNSVQVSIGGYAQCFSSCSDTSDCAGFTFVGVDGGTCYLKATMPRDTYVAKSMNNYVSYAKVNATAVAPQPTPTPAPSKQPSKGAIASGVVGGIAVLGLVLFLIAFLARRRRKEIESKRATLTHVFGGAIEPGRPDDNDRHTLPLHNRHGSTGADPFVQFGGFQRGPGSIATRDYATHSQTTSPASIKTANALNRPQTLEPDTIPYNHNRPPNNPQTPPPPIPYFLPSTTYNPHQPPPESIPMLDSTPVPRSTSRSPRFHEHISELEDTSSPPPVATPFAPATRNWQSMPYNDTDSPTLGNPLPNTLQPGHSERLDDARRRQEELHTLSSNFYGQSQQGGNLGVGGASGGREPPQLQSQSIDGRIKGREDEKVSPDDSGSPLDRKFIVSPMGTLGRGRK